MPQRKKQVKCKNITMQQKSVITHTRAQTQTHASTSTRHNTKRLHCSKTESYRLMLYYAVYAQSWFACTSTV